MATRDHGRRTLARCPSCYEISPCTRCVEPIRIEAPRWLNAVCWLALGVIFVGTNILLWRL